MNPPTRLLALVSVAVILTGLLPMKSRAGETPGAPKAPYEIGDRVTLTTAHCSLRVPKGWGRKPSPSGGVIFAAPKSSGHTANFSIVDEEFAGTLREYADLTLQQFKEMAKDVVTISAAAPFAADSGLRALKVSIQSKVGGKEISQAFYFFDAGAGQKYVATAAVPTKDAAQFMPLMDGCLKTVEKK